MKLETTLRMYILFAVASAAYLFFKVMINSQHTHQLKAKDHHECCK